MLLAFVIASSSVVWITIKVSEYKDFMAHFKALSEYVIAYCESHGKQYHIKEETFLKVKPNDLLRAAEAEYRDFC